VREGSRFVITFSNISLDSKKTLKAHRSRKWQVCTISGIVFLVCGNAQLQPNERKVCIHVDEMFHDCIRFVPTEMFYNWALLKN